MPPNPIVPFEYVTILVSIILGLGITQILGAFSELLYNHKAVRFFWPHSVWIVFILFLHVQDWFVTYALRFKPSWSLPELVFVLLYPILLFMAAKLLLPTHEREERANMYAFYMGQYPMIFLLVALGVGVSIVFNIWLLQAPFSEQWHLLVFLAVLAWCSWRKPRQVWLHGLLAAVMALGSLLSVWLENDTWVIG